MTLESHRRDLARCSRYKTFFSSSDIYDSLVENYDPVPDEAIRVLLRESFKDTLEVANLLPFIKRCQKDSPYLRTSGKGLP